MATALDTYGTVFKNGAAILLARAVGGDGQPIRTTDVSQIQYSVLELDDCKPDASTAVSGHQDVALAVGSVVYDSLQNDSLWSVDTIGYNFRHEIDVSINEAFPKAGVSYRVRYVVTPTTGQKLTIRFHLRAI